MKAEFYYVNNPRDMALRMVAAQFGKKTIDHIHHESGAFADVYVGSELDVVYKVGMIEGNEAYLSWINAILRSKTENPLVPKIYGVRFLFNKTDEVRFDKINFPVNYYRTGVFVIAMEKLDKLEYKKSSKVIDWLHGRISYKRESTWDYDTSLKKAKPPKKFQKMSLTPENYEEIRKLLNKARENHSFDFHSENIMLRDKTIVITDPLC